MSISVSFEELLRIVYAFGGMNNFPYATDNPRINWIVDNIVNQSQGETIEPYDEMLYKDEISALQNSPGI